MNKALQVLGFSAAAALLAAGCSSPSLFNEYKNESFLTTASLRDDAWQLMPDYSFESGTSVSDYMDFSLDSSSGGPNGGPSYRLEIKNLLANGDFENGTANGWYHYDGTGVPGGVNDPATGSAEAQMNEPSQSMDGANYLYFSTTANYRLGLVLNNANNVNYNSALINPNTYIDGKLYVFGFNYRAYDLTAYYEQNWDGTTLSLTDTSYQYKGGINGTDVNPGFNYNYAPPLDPDLAEANNGNVFTADNSSGADTLFFTSDTIQTAYIDNVTVVRDTSGDFDLRLRLKLNIDHRSDLDLIAGYYRFSVYVKAENSGTNNVFEADRVELGINGYDTDNQMSYEKTKVFYKTSALHNLYSQSGDSFQGDWSSGWTQLVFETNQTVQLPDISADSVMELTISPSNPGSSDNGWNRLDAGSILIAEPSLEYSDGPWD